MKRQSLLRNHFTLTFTALLVLLMLFTIGRAQQGTASVRGTVTDQQGKVVAGASVTLLGAERNFSRTQTTNSEGGYVFTSVPPGKYKLQCENSGFKKTNIDVEALVDTAAKVDVQLEVGSVTETVNVIAGATETPLNTTDATIGNTFTQQQVVNLPLNARNVVGLLSLQPGVVPNTESAEFTDEAHRGGYVNGSRSDQSNVTLDGVDVNEQQGGAAFFSVLRSTPDSLQEFRVTTTNANADQGRSSGAQVSLITKSGTNAFHGSLYEYHRNTVTTANNWFNNQAGVERPALLRNNFGGAIGGPIKKNKIFFFANYEGFRQASSTTVVRQVPLPTLGQGIVRYRSATGASGVGCPTGTPAGVICLTRAQISAAYLAANGIDPGTNSAVLSVLSAAATRYPANDTTTGDGLNTGGFRFNASTPVRQNAIIGRFDANLTNRQILSLRFNYQDDHSTGIRRFPDTLAPINWQHPKGMAANHTWTISRNIINNFRYGLTRDSFTNGGDSQANSISFRFIFQPLNFSRTLSRVTPVHNFVDDLTWIRGNHTFQAGANIRLITNSRTSQGQGFDSAVVNPSFYDFSGDVVLVSDAGDDIFANVGGSPDDLRDALSTVIGRYSQYNLNQNYAKSGSLLAAGTPIPRTFKTQEYEFYAQDSWKLKPNLTLSYGLRWSTSTPVYEANGFQVTPTQSLADVFARRVAGAAAGTPFNDSISIDLAGKANNKPGYYRQDWNNFAPSVAVAWQPTFKHGILGAILGDNKSTLRGGFRKSFDHLGGALAVGFDLNSTLGFRLSPSIAANTFNVSDRLGPLFTGPGQSIRGLPLLPTTPTLNFPLTTPADEDQRIESSLDDSITTPYNYNYNFSWGRDLGKGYSIEVSYVGRNARSLLVSRDIMHLNNLRDPKSGDTFYTAINKLIGLRYAKAAITSVAKIPYFENIVPGLAGTYNVLGTNVVLTATQAAYRRVAMTSVGGRNTTDYTFVQLLWDDGLGYGNNLFFHPQYAAFVTLSSIGTSDYHSMQVSFRKRLSKDFGFDLNYTYGHSLDTASGNETTGSGYGSTLILNPLVLNQNRANSDFDIRHIINFNYIWGLPIGKGKRFFNSMGKLENGILGGWQFTGIFRFNTGLPAGQPYDDARWATNWNVQSNTVALNSLQTTPTRTGNPNLFSDPVAAYRSYRNAVPGEGGDRNILRDPSYIVFDAGLYKSFSLSETKKIIFRWEVFNVTNTQRFTGVDGTGFGLPRDPFLYDPSAGTGTPPPTTFGNLTAIQGTPRIMQFALRFEF
jgi:Carboxypeptidase regulatory-like domain/TonB dependent receptor